MFTTIDTLYSVFLQSHSVVIDSRKIEENDLFFALKGDHTDGNKYALKAIEAGAIGAVVDDPSLSQTPGCYLVEDVLKTLQTLAQFHRSHFHFPVIGLTGSNGKTTTKELILTTLRAKFNVIATKGNLNNHIGVPLTLLSVKSNPDFLIVEMGANHQGEIAFLSEICQPDYGLITNVGKAHLEGFGGFEGVKNGKSELYRYIATNQGTLFVNQEDKELMSLLPKIPEEKLVYYRPSEYVSGASDTFLHFMVHNKSHSTHLTGNYNLPNVAAAIRIGDFFGVEAEKIVSSIESYIPDNNRSQKLEYKGMNLFLDAYNANPTSMRASIQNFAELKLSHKILMLGDMFELGNQSRTEHSSLISWLSQFDWKQVVFIGKYFSESRIEKDNFIYFQSTEEAKPIFQSHFYTGANILLKGSRGIALEKLWQ